MLLVEAEGQTYNNEPTGHMLDSAVSNAQPASEEAVARAKLEHYAYVEVPSTADHEATRSLRS